MTEIPRTVIGRMSMIAQLLAEPEECECDKCGDKHMTSGGLFQNLSKEEKEKLIKELKASLNQG